MGRIVDVSIVEEQCLAHEMCVTECPEVFQIRHGDSFASIKPDAANYYGSNDRDIRSAVACCPMSCIRIVETDN